MLSDGSISQCVGQLQAGDSAAAQKIWACYFSRLVGLARQKLQSVPRRAADEEDVALSALDSFCRGAERGRFPELADREGLWRLLVVITARKAYQLVLHEGRQKRRGNLAAGALNEDRLLEEMITDQGPTPEFAAQAAEECQRLLESLGDAQLRSVALWKMEGYTSEEIAAKLGCTLRTVERKLRVIRSLWEQEESTP